MSESTSGIGKQQQSKLPCDRNMKAKAQQAQPNQENEPKNNTMRTKSINERMSPSKHEKEARRPIATASRKR